MRCLHQAFCTITFVLFAGHAIAQKQKKNDTPNDKELYGGCWFVPHNATTNIRFSGFSDFVFSDYDSKAGRDITLTGKFLLDGHNLWLIYNDRAKQRFYIYKGKDGDTNYYIKGYPPDKSSYYFVHGECE